MIAHGQLAKYPLDGSVWSQTHRFASCPSHELEFLVREYVARAFVDRAILSEFTGVGSPFGSAVLFFC